MNLSVASENVWLIPTAISAQGTLFSLTLYEVRSTQLLIYSAACWMSENNTSASYQLPECSSEVLGWLCKDGIDKDARNDR